MKLPIINEIQKTVDMIDVFKGYNHNLRINEGEFYNMENLSSTKYPVVSPRGQRGLFVKEDNTFPVKPQGLVQKESFCYVDGKDFVVGDRHVHLDLSEDKEDCPKQLVSMGAYVIILPDKKWVNTIDVEDFGDIETSFSTSGATTFQMSTVSGSKEATVSNNAPTDPSNMDLWVDTSATPNTLKQWVASSGTWVSLPTGYVKISSPNIGRNFEVNDGVIISGIKNEQITDLNNTMIIWDKGKDYIVVTGVINEVITQEDTITIERKMPTMDFVIESENRLWGCRYGVSANGQMVNEIYASKLGDFKNWNCFMGISTDSYAVTVGTDGYFTGAIAHLGHPIFFKENCMHRVYGNYPANYQISTTACRGVQKGSHKSLAIVNEILYYKSQNAICAYDGSLPQEISYSLGKVSYSNAVACAHGNKYYISMHDDTLSKSDLSDIKNWHLFVYDTSIGLWHREDNTRVTDFCSSGEELYYIDHVDNRIKSMFGSGSKDTAKVKWMAETGYLGTNAIGKKYVSKINIRMSLELNTNVYFYIQYDSRNDWEFLFRMEGTSLSSFTVPIRPRRCDHFKIKIEGEGEAKIFSMSKTIEQGSDA